MTHPSPTPPWCHPAFSDVQEQRGREGSLPSFYEGAVTWRACTGSAALDIPSDLTQDRPVLKYFGGDAGEGRGAMRHTSCGHDNPVGSSFRNSCGSGLGLRYTAYGLTNPHGSAFCNDCGARQTEAAPPIASVPPQPSLAVAFSFAPGRHQVQRLLRFQSDMTGASLILLRTIGALSAAKRRAASDPGRADFGQPLWALGEEGGLTERETHYNCSYTQPSLPRGARHQEDKAV